MARSLNGTSDYMRYSGAVVSAAPLTMSCWAKRPGAGDSGHVMGIYQSGYFNNWHQFCLRWAVTGGGNATITAHAGGATSSATASINRSITDWPDDTWQHIAAVFGSTTSRYAYAQGVASSQSTTSITPSGLDRTTMGIQDNSAGGAQAFGHFAEAAIWSAALDAAEIAALAAGVCPLLVRPTSLVAYWPLIGQYSPEIDIKGGFNFTLNGTATADHPRTYRSSGLLQMGKPAAAPAASSSHLTLLGVG